MGSIVYDYLTESFLFNDADIDSSYARYSDQELATELERYREYVDAHEEALFEEMDGFGGRVRLLPDSASIDIDILRRCAWYVDQFVIRDPLYALGEPENKHHRVMSEFLGIGRETHLLRARVLKVVRLLKELTPSVASNYVKLLPISRVFEPPTQLPLYYSENGYSDALPKDTMDWFRCRSLVREVKKHDRSLIVLPPPSCGILQPCRRISVSFKDSAGIDNEGTIHGYQLLEQETTSFDPATNMAGFRMYEPSEPPGQLAFDGWVQQSVHQAARDVYQRSLYHLGLSTKLRSMVLTQSPVTAELLQSQFGENPSVATDVVDAIVRLDVRFLDGVDLATLMKVRDQDGEAFEAFRLALERELRGIRQETDPAKAHAKAKNAVHELEAVQLQAVETKIRNLQRKGMGEGLLSAASFAGVVATSGATLIGAVIAALQGYKTISDLIRTSKEHPAFFLWKVRKAKSRR